MALDDYFLNPSKDCLSRLFDAVNSMDISGAPLLTRHEKLIMRCSERKDVFAEKFRHPESAPLTATMANQQLLSKFGHGRDGSLESKLSFEEGVLAKKRESKDRDDNSSFIIDGGAPPSTSSHGSGSQSRPQTGTPSQGSTLGQSSPSDSSFSLGGSAVWVGDDGGGDHTMNGKDKEPMRIPPSISRHRKSIDASSTSSSNAHGNGIIPHLALGDPLHGIKDTHFFPTTIAYKGHQLPIKMPLSTFPEEVGDVWNFLCFTGIISSADGNTIPVLADSVGSDVFYTDRDRCWTASSTFAHEWVVHTSCHPVIQRADHRETDRVPGSQQAGGPSGQLRPFRLRVGIWVWVDFARVRRTRLSLRTPDKQGGMGIHVCTRLYIFHDGSRY